MYRNLNPVALGITGRQSELIELALTYGFGGLDLDIAAIVKRVRKSNREQACRFIASAGIHGGGFTLPVDLTAAEATFQSGLVELAEYAEIASALDARGFQITVRPVVEGMPYQESFELHRSRLATVAGALESHNLRVGLAFQAAPGHREGAETPFIHTGEALLTLIRTIGHPQVGIALDTWDWVVGGGSLESLCQIPLESIVSVQLADIPAGTELGSITDQQRVLPGEEGQIDCRTVVQHLLSNEFDGPVTLCPNPSTLAGMTRDAIVQLAKATFDDLCNPNPPVVDTGADAAAESDESADGTEEQPAGADVAGQ